MKQITGLLFLIACVSMTGCRDNPQAPKSPDSSGGPRAVSAPADPIPVELPPRDTPAKKTAKTIHVFVALCDNASQGIVPVPAALGDGNDPRNNLYWGAMYGVKSFLKRSDAWSFVQQSDDPGRDVLERVVFKRAGANAYIVADAYRGTSIKKCITDFLSAAGGNNPATLKVGDETLGLSGSADMVVYVGHNGLMEFDVPAAKPAAPGGQRCAIALACKTKPYFRDRLVALKCKPVLLTTGFMAPEAYTLDAAVCAWLSGATHTEIKERSAAAYNKYQKCGMRGARRLFYSE